MGCAAAIGDGVPTGKAVAGLHQAAHAQHRHVGSGQVGRAIHGHAPPGAAVAGIGDREGRQGRPLGVQDDGGVGGIARARGVVGAQAVGLRVPADEGRTGQFVARVRATPCVLVWAAGTVPLLAPLAL